ncbi:hypothetical protein L6452_44436 [Arctium lappa]|uniref:Uncharacterized protein n=1 Tax=Arctium lappa TaxID=4217 RepID=A0ACB8XGH1_ARCLA|nr:hypothetical protein L6452_44436 [Arctium lappa]
MASSSSVRTLEPSKIYLPNCWNRFLDRLSEMHDLGEKMFLVNKAKFILENEAARLATSQLEPFSMTMELVTNAIISIDEEKEGVIKDMKKLKAPVTYANMSKGKGVAKEGTLQGRCFASGSDHEGTSSSLFGRQLQKVMPLPSLAFGDKDTLPTCPYIQIKERLFGKGEPSSGAAMFDAEHHLTAEVTRNSRKRNREFEEPINEDIIRHGVCMQLDQDGRGIFLAPFWEQPALGHFSNLPLRTRDGVIASNRTQFRP